MLRRLGLLMLVVTVALATVAHDWCRLTCATAATHAAIVSTSSAHAHCAQADTDAEGLRVSAGMPPCQIDSDITPATVVSKIAMIAPAAIPLIIVTPVASRIATVVRPASPRSGPSASPIPLRV